MLLCPIRVDNIDCIASIDCDDETVARRVSGRGDGGAGRVLLHVLRADRIRQDAAHCGRYARQLRL